MRARNVTRRRAVLAGLAAAAVMALPRGASPETALGTLTVGLAVADSFEYLPAYVAQDKALWARRGLEVRIVTFGGDAKLQEALASGRVDVGLGSAPAAVAAIAAGQRAKVVAALSNSVRLFGLIAAKPGLSARDLRGRTIGVTGPNAISDILVRALAASLGADPASGIGRAYLGGYDNNIAALRARRVDGIVWTIDGLYAAQDQHLGSIVVNFGDVMPKYTYGVVVATDALARDRRPALDAFLGGLFDAQRIVRRDRAYTVEMQRRAMGTPAPIGERVWDAGASAFTAEGGFDDAALARMMESLVTVGVLPAPLARERWLMPLGTGAAPR